MCLKSFQGKLSTEVLDISLPNKAKAVYSNSRQLASQYNKKRLDVEENAISLLYKPFEPFSNQKYQELIHFTEKLLADEDYDNLMLLSEEIIHLSLSGLHYYHNYYQRPLLLLVTASFLGWIACLLKSLSEQQFNTQTEPSNLKSFSSSKGILSRCMNTLFVFMSVVSSYIVYGNIYFLFMLPYSLM